MTFWSALPKNLLSSIYQPPATDEERHDVYDAAPFEVEEGWTCVDTDKRLKRAYYEGGFPLWARATMREVEAEARVSTSQSPPNSCRIGRSPAGLLRTLQSPAKLGRTGTELGRISAKIEYIMQNSRFS